MNEPQSAEKEIAQIVKRDILNRLLEHINMMQTLGIFIQHLTTGIESQVFADDLIGFHTCYEGLLIKKNREILETAVVYDSVEFLQEMAQQAFERGADRAKGLHHTHPLKLKLALDQARFLYYLIGDSESKNDAK